MLFRYRGHFNGRLESGTIWADRQDVAVAHLQSNGIQVQSINGKSVGAASQPSRKAIAAAKKLKKSTPLIDAIRDKDRKRVHELLSTNHDVHERNIRGETPLEIAVGYYDEDLVQLLLQHGARPDAESTAGGTVLEYARRLSGENAPAVVRLLQGERGELPSPSQKLKRRTTSPVDARREASTRRSETHPTKHSDRIRFTCPSCSKTVSCQKTFAGKQGKCPHCATIVSIPSATSPSDQGRGTDLQDLLKRAHSIENEDELRDLVSRARSLAPAEANKLLKAVIRRPDRFSAADPRVDALRGLHQKHLPPGEFLGLLLDVIEREVNNIKNRQDPSDMFMLMCIDRLIKHADWITKDSDARLNKLEQAVRSLTPVSKASPTENFDSYFIFDKTKAEILKKLGAARQEAARQLRPSNTKVADRQSPTNRATASVGKPSATTPKEKRRWWQFGQEKAKKPSTVPSRKTPKVPVASSPNPSPMIRTGAHYTLDADRISCPFCRTPLSEDQKAAFRMFRFSEPPGPGVVKTDCRSCGRKYDCTGGGSAIQGEAGSSTASLSLDNIRCPKCRNPLNQPQRATIQALLAANSWSQIQNAQIQCAFCHADYAIKDSTR